MDMSALVQQLRAAAAASRWRAVIAVSGEASWCRRLAAEALAVTPDEAVWVGDAPPHGCRHVAPERAPDLLGGECDLAVVDAHAGFDADGFGAVAGSVRAGGLLLLLAPPLTEWPAYADPQHARIAVYPSGAAGVSGRFLARIARGVGENRGIALLEQGRAPRLPPPSPPPAQALPVAPPCLTPDQAEAVQVLVHVVRGHRRRPLVLVADRGRGKSAALGIAAARLLAEGIRRILITAPRLDATAAVFARAADGLEACERRRGELTYAGAALRFVPPDELAATLPGADLVLVDEAAGIPTPLLERLLAHYSRIAFATTVHGYEGTGRGFAVRFYRTLDRLTPRWRELRLERPIRWAPGDALEALVLDALLLDAAPVDDPAARAATEQSPLVCRRLERDRLLADDRLLRQLFGLLVTAHYRTRPQDLRHLLDGPNVEVWAALAGECVLGVLLAAREGGFDTDLARAVWDGTTRPHGHLLPESLAAHLGLGEAPARHAVRVMRIAVHPAVQGQGIGSRLLQRVAEAAAATGADYLGSSFGAGPEGLRFWQLNGLAPVRVSLKRGAASNAHSVMVLQPLSPAGTELVAAARARFAAHLPHMLGESLTDLDPDLALALVTACPVAAPELSEADWMDAVALACGRRVPEVVPGVLWPLALALLVAPADDLTHPQRVALLTRALQRRGWGEVAALTGTCGRREALALLRSALRPALARWAPAAVQAEAARLERVWAGTREG